MAKMANLAKNLQRAGENFNEITRGAPCREEKLTKMVNLTKMANLVKIENLIKICHGFGKYSNWMPKVILGVAILTKMANIAKIRQSPK